MDGVVASGSAAVDQAPITGESMPVGKQPGDQVFAGSIVEGGSLTVRATSTAADNTIAKIVHLVEEAQAERAPVQGLVDRFAARYTPAVVGLAVLVAVLPPLLGAPLTTWFYRGLALLIISCPCALVISTPVSILAALGTATRHGTLVKGGVYLEQAARLRAVALDKTGTLTEGAPRVTDVVALDGVSQGRVLAVAAACEQHSEHALARAIVAAANGTGHAAAASTDARRPGGPARGRALPAHHRPRRARRHRGPDLLRRPAGAPRRARRRPGAHGGRRPSWRSRARPSSRSAPSTRR